MASTSIQEQEALSALAGRLEELRCSEEETRMALMQALEDMSEQKVQAPRAAVKLS